MLGKLRDLMGLAPEGETYSEEYRDSSAGASTSTLTTEQPTGSVSMSRPTLGHRSEPSPASIPESTSSGSNVTGMPNVGRWWGAVAEVIVMQPRSFSEMPEVIKALKERKSVVLNLTLMEADQAQRSVDFVAGATFTIDGHQERIGESIFLFTPNCVQVSTQVGGVRPASPVSGGATSPWDVESQSRSA